MMHKTQQSGHALSCCKRTQSLVHCHKCWHLLLFTSPNMTGTAHAVQVYGHLDCLALLTAFHCLQQAEYKPLSLKLHACDCYAMHASVEALIIVHIWLSCSCNLSVDNCATHQQQQQIRMQQQPVHQCTHDVNTDMLLNLRLKHVIQLVGASS